MTDITSLSLFELIKNIKEKKISSNEAAKSFVDRSQKSKKLNAYVTENFENCLKLSKEFDNKPNYDLKLPGIPIAVKDLFCTNEVRTTAGSNILNNFVPSYESTVTQNIWNEGGILLGKLNCDEFAMGSSNETSFFGNVQNPIAKDLVPGGSSGGSSSALAANLTPVTIGTDTGGSIRQPASFTGTVGLKPTYGSCSRYGIVAFASSLDQAGPMSKDVKDSSILLEVISSFDKKDSTSIDFKRNNYSSELTRNIKGLKIGIPKEYRIDGMPDEIEKLWKKGIEYAKDLVPGGSSGGSSSALAANLTPVTIGTDTGGSIRQPASFTGTVGLKPTYGSCSRYGIVAFASSLDQAGPMSKDVKDSSILLEVISSFDKKDSTSIDFKRNNYSSELTRNIKGIKIGIPKEYRVDGMPDEIENLWKKGIEYAKDCGAEIIDISLPHTSYALPTYYIVAPAEASSNLARYDGVKYGLRSSGESLIDMYEKTRSEGFGEEVKRRIMIGTYVLSSGYYDAYYLKAQKVRQLIKQDFDQAYNKVDAILTPSTPSSAFKIGEKSNDPVSMYLNDIFTVPVNLAGLPGISIPAGTDKNNYPLGLQIIGKPFDEQTVLNIAYSMEEKINYKNNITDWWME